MWIHGQHVDKYDWLALFLQRGLSSALVELSFSFWSSWSCWWTLPIPGMSPGWTKWKLATPGAGMQVSGCSYGCMSLLFKKNITVTQQKNKLKLSRKKPSTTICRHRVIFNSLNDWLCFCFIDLLILFLVLFLALLGVTILNYILALIAMVLCIVFYTKPDGCFINKFFISFNMLFCVVASIISVLPKVQVLLTFSK